jgi:hypothetical protein
VLVYVLAGGWIDAMTSTGILILEGVLGFVRVGDAWTVPNRDVVPGDVLLIEAGDIVAADARVVYERHLQCHEPALTGESKADGNGRLDDGEAHIAVTRR